MRREPSRRRAAWITTSTEAVIISRMVREGSEKPPMVIIDSRRESPSRGLLACSVPIEPSWPVFMACNRSKASGPRTSPTMIRSGRMRRQLRTRSRMVIWPSPSRWPRFQPHHMRLLQLQFGGVLAGDDALIVVDVAGQAVEQRRFTGTGAAGNEDVRPATAAYLEVSPPFRRDRAIPDKLLERQLVLPEFADGERRSVDRQRRHDG